ncbi:MAG: 2'-5' RNA ligase family protein [Deinococcales bacterium]
MGRSGVMEGKSPLTAVVAVLPEELWPPVQEIRRRHDRQLHRWMPHVTLLYPFLPSDRLTAARPRLRQVAAESRAFEVELAHFELFRHERAATLWLRPEPNDPFEALRTALESAFPGMDDTRRFAHGFTPHLSVGQAPLDEAEGLRAALQAGWRPLRWRVDAVALIRRGPPPRDVFRIDALAPLSSP